VVAAAAWPRAAGAYPACFTYLVAGRRHRVHRASPELLVRRSGRAVTSQPMAGSTAAAPTRPRPALPPACWPAPRTREHRVTAGTCRRAGRVLRRGARDRPEIVRLTNIQHLATTVSGQLRDPSCGALDLAASLHPTPAINGAPPAAAHRLIAELEAWSEAGTRRRGC